MPKHAPEAPEEPKGSDSLPPAVTLILGGLSKNVRPTAVALLTIGAMIGGAFWLDSRAQAYIRSANVDSVGPLKERLEANGRQLEEHDARLRQFEQDRSEMKADIRTIKGDLSYLRERADRRTR